MKKIKFLIFLILLTFIEVSGIKVMTSTQISAGGSSSTGEYASTISTTQPTGGFWTFDRKKLVCLGPNTICVEATKNPPTNQTFSVLVEPTSIDFGLGKTQFVDKVFYLTNNGTVDLTGFSCRLDYESERWVSVLDCPSALNVSNDNFPVTVRFDARNTSVGPHYTVMSFGNQNASAQATALTMVFDDSGGQGEYDFIVAPVNENFELALNETQTHSYWLTNTGLRELSGFSCTEENDRNYVSYATGCPNTLPPNQMQPVQFSYDGVVADVGFDAGEDDQFNLLFNASNAEGEKTFVYIDFVDSNGSNGEITYPTPLPTLPPDINFATAACPFAVVVSNNALIDVKLYVGGKPTCDSKRNEQLKLTLAWPDGSTHDYFNPACLPNDLNQFKTPLSGTGLYSAEVDASEFGIQEKASCQFRALGKAQVQANELDLLALLAMLFGVFLFLGKRK